MSLAEHPKRFSTAPVAMKVKIEAACRPVEKGKEGRFNSKQIYFPRFCSVFKQLQLQRASDFRAYLRVCSPGLTI